MSGRPIPRPVCLPSRISGWSRCRAALSDPQLVSGPVGATPFTGNNLLLMDGEPHRAARRVVTAWFDRPRLDRVGRHLETIRHDLVRDVADRADADLVRDLAEPLVLEAIFSLMEISGRHRPQLSAHVRDMTGMLEPDLDDADRNRAINAALRATLTFERDGAHGCAQGLHAALEEAAAEGIIPVKVARTTPVVVLHGGYENPLNQLGCIIAWAAEDPPRFRAVAGQSAGLLFEEVLRLYSPVRRVARKLAEPDPGAPSRPVHGQFWIDLEAANRDEAAFGQAGEVDLGRERRHLGFGHGRHMCPGTALARLAGKMLIRCLLELPDDLLRALSVTWREGAVARGPLTIVRR